MPPFGNRSTRRNLFGCQNVCLTLTSLMICHKIHVSIRKSRSPDYLGPFKRRGASYHGRQNVVEFLLIQFPQHLRQLRKWSHSFGTPCIKNNIGTSIIDAHKYIFSNGVTCSAVIRWVISRRLLCAAAGGRTYRTSRLLNCISQLEASATTLFVWGKVESYILRATKVF